MGRFNNKKYYLKLTMSYKSRLEKWKNKIHKKYADYTDRQLLEQIAYSLQWLGISVGIISWFVIMYWWFNIIS